MGLFQRLSPKKYRLLVRGLFQRSDFKRNPARALLRRLAWRLRWRFSRKPWLLPFHGHFTIAVANDGQGALLFYQGYSEPETEKFILRFLKPGMSFIDVGAHIGKYTLLGAHAVRREGEVHAFEPNPVIFDLLRRNVRENGFQNVHMLECAVSNHDGPEEFEVCAEATFSALKRKTVRLPRREVAKAIRVESVRLDTYFADKRKKANLVKVDVEGAELMVFMGSRSLLELSAEEAPVWVFEYEPENYASFGYAPEDLFALLARTGHRVWYCRDGEGGKPADTLRIPSDVHILIAAKEGACLPWL
jgi:FkbM family methyltransferase